MPLNPQKKLQRLPHIFSQFLELPLRSQADVFIEDRYDCFRFTANVDNNVFAGGHVRAYAVKIHPSVTKASGNNTAGVGGGGCDGRKAYCYGAQGWPE
ncbi:hypothetical protein L1987_50863 [Smallanthus sonchifolius]|uniref:Uncharacterized protein n=1 Tax=Smallanthus sonchifolius TaxID=185202 RepID=A0ACB9EPC3_9ASTR|nr:hypothetical protein L1987_50863 [Smallanthus sonchifolius]